MGLLIGAVVIGLVALAVWPGRALVARAGRVRRDTERVRLEDALKHLHDYERAGRTGTLENLAGRLEITRGAASELLTRLEERGLARSGATGWELTDAGRTYALRVVRTHRLWERYLADRTGVPAREWHAEAERVEHELSPEEADRLAARLGHPRYDPHGDPIPTRAGEIPAPAGMSLTRVEPGRRVKVLHLEDEPPEVFDRLLSAGLAPGVVVEVVGLGAGGGAAVTGGRSGIRIHAGGRELELRQVEAANVTVEAVAAAAAQRPEPTAVRRTLADAEPGEQVRVRSISPGCQGLQRRRLLDLGVVPGTVITPELVSTAGDPVAYRIRGALIALRRSQARWIDLEPEELAAGSASVGASGAGVA